MAAPGIFIPAVTLSAGTDAETDATRAASVGKPAATVNHVHITLSDGGQMPSVGLGTWLTVGPACYDLVVSGLHAGLRHIKPQGPRTSGEQSRVPGRVPGRARSAAHTCEPRL